MTRPVSCRTATLVCMGLLLPVTAIGQGNAPVRLEGVVTVVLIDDFDRQTVQTTHELSVEGESQPLELEFPGPPPFALRTGQRVQVVGRELPGRRVGVEDITVLEIGPGGGGGGGGGRGGGGGKSSRSVAVLLIDLIDANALLTPLEAESRMWGPIDSVQDIYMRNSHGKIDFVADSDGDGAADVYGPFDVSMTGAGSCSYRSWSNAARAQAVDGGINLNNRDHYVYVLTGHTNNGCSFGGVAELDGDEVWINYPPAFVFLHELGHNLNQHHAGSDPDNDGNLNSAYGDGSCFMGASYRNVFLNAPHNEAMGYLKESSGAIQDVPNSPGVYRYVLAPLASDSSAVLDPQILRIPRSDLGRTYYLSVRDGSGYDANLHSNYQSGVSIHWYRPDAPGTVTGYVTTLTDGESFVDLINGITVTQNARAADGSWVDIDVRIEATFDVRAPGFDVTSFSGQLGAENTVGAFESARYVLTLQNNDGPDTPPSTWTFTTRNIPVGMTATFDQPSVLLAPGESATVGLTVEPNGADDGTYVFYVDATDADGIAPHHLVVDDYARLVVDDVSVAPEPPTGLTGSSYTSKGKLYVSLGWSPSPSSDVTYRIFIDDSPIPRYWRSASGISFSSRWIEEPGTYTFMVAAENSAGKLSLMSGPLAVTIEKSGGR